MSRGQFGGARKLPSGRWQARYRTPDGRRLTARHTFATKSEATLWISALRADIASGHRFNPNAGRVKLKDFAASWIEYRTGLAPRTREIYENQIHNHILPAATRGSPALGEVMLVDLDTPLIRAWYRALQLHRGESIAAKAYVRLRQILSQAVSDDMIPKNPCRIEGGGVEHHQEQRFVRLEDLYALAQVVGTRYRALVLAAGLAGLRQGELFALRWRDVDVQAGVIRVHRKRLRLSSGEVVEDRPKSRAGVRSVAIPGALINELEAHAKAVGARPDGYVFTSSEGNPIDANNFRHRVWSPATEAAGLTGLRFHGLRHTAGTLAAQTGATTRELMVRLGHASPGAAMVYQHAAAGRDRTIAAELDSMIRRLNSEGDDSRRRRESHWPGGDSSKGHIEDRSDYGKP